MKIIIPNVIKTIPVIIKNDQQIIKSSELLLDDASNTHSNNEDNALEWLKEISKKEKKKR